MALERLELPGWPGGISAALTTREGGHSVGSWQGFNLGDHVGDDAESVAANRQLLAESWGEPATFHWLRQVHGTRIVQAGATASPPEADGAWTDRAGVACAVLVADCLPLLFCSDDGACVAAVHAGWRGLAAGVIERAVQSLPVAPHSLLVWLGPCIGPCHFRIGDDVAARLRAGQPAQAADCFVPALDDPGHQLADLQGLAQLRLEAAGVARISRDRRCTYCDAARFFSHRRDGQSGRMAALISRNSP